MPKLFKSDTEVPELCPPELLLPEQERFLRYSKPSTTGNVSPVELSWLLFAKDNPSGSPIPIVGNHLLQVAELGEVEETLEDIADCNYLNHCYRVVARIALDPRRYETFDFAEAYDLDRGKQFPNRNERIYFEDFHRTFGVVERDLPFADV